MAPSTVGQPLAPVETNDPYLDFRVSIAFIVIDTAFLVLFYVSRSLNKKAVGLPMLICNTLCYVLCLGSAATGILMTKIGGVGYHVSDVPVEVFQRWLKLSKVLEFTYTPAVMFAKLAALFLYYQVFEVPVYRRIIVGIGVIIILQGIIAFILAFAICRPFRYFWTQAVDPQDGSCGDVMLFYKSYSIPSLVTDVMMLVLPWPLLLRLHIPTSEKIGLILTFLAASLGIITCALRFTVFFTTPLFSDPTWYASGGPMIYALVEPSIYMIASILPTTRHLYRRMRQKSKLNAQLRIVKSQSSEQTENIQGTQSTKVEPTVAADRRGTTSEVDIARIETVDSRDGQTVEKLHQEYEWEQETDQPEGSQKILVPTKPRELVRKQVEVRDRGRPTG